MIIGCTTHTGARQICCPRAWFISPTPTNADAPTTHTSPRYASLDPQVPDLAVGAPRGAHRGGACGDPWLGGAAAGCRGGLWMGWMLREAVLPSQSLTGCRAAYSRQGLASEAGGQAWHLTPNMLLMLLHARAHTHTQQVAAKRAEMGEAKFAKSKYELAKRLIRSTIQVRLPLGCPCFRQRWPMPCCLPAWPLGDRLQHAAVCSAVARGPACPALRLPCFVTP